MLQDLGDAVLELKLDHDLTYRLFALNRESTQTYSCFTQFINLVSQT